MVMSWSLTYRRRARCVALMLVAACADGPHQPTQLGLVATADELRTLVGALAHDSLRGRRASSSEDQKATAYVAALAESYGLTPVGGAGASFFHEVPGSWRTVSSGSVDVNGAPLAMWTDVVPLLPRTSNPALSWDATAVYGGTLTSVTQPLPPNLDVAGRAVVMQSGGPLLASLAPENPLAAAAVVFLVAGPLGPEVVAVAQARRLLAGAALRNALGAPVVVTVTPAVAEQLMGAPLSGMQVGHVGGRTRGTIAITSESAPMRNVVAVLPGSDATLAAEYVALGAHLDHIGVRQAGNPTDSIYNGADDNASGSAALLMIARGFAGSPVRPRRSLVFIWFAAEELGLFGSEAYSHAPTVGLGTMSAFVNLDMISRGGAGDIEGGGEAYLQSVGSRRGSTQLGPIVDSVAAAHGFQLDYSFDAPGHEERVFCRSDHWNFARFGVPVVFFSTGVHADYHGVDDETERSDFDKLARVTTMVSGLVEALGSRPSRVARDLPAPDPNASCQQ
jgi:hypothetical protein